MRFPLLTCLATLLWALLVRANLEKNVFLTPSTRPPVKHRDFRKHLIEQGIEVLNPTKNTLTRTIHAAWPHSPRVSEPYHAYVLLDELDPGRRHEIRICTSAMTPCALNFTTYQIADVLANSTVKSSLEEYLETWRADKPKDKDTPLSPSTPIKQQVLYFIQIDPWFFSTDEKAMKDGILVDINLTLDPYLINILPVTAIPISIYMTILAAIGISLSSLVWRAMQDIATVETDTKVKAGQQIKDD